MNEKIVRAIVTLREDLRERIEEKVVTVKFRSNGFVLWNITKLCVCQKAGK